MYISWFVFPTLLLLLLLFSSSFFFFDGMFLSVFGYIVSDSRCIGTSLHPHLFLSLSFSVSVSVSEYIISNLYVCDQSRSARSACNSAIEILFYNFYLCVCYVRLLISTSFTLSISECLYQCPVILCLIVCACTSLHRDSYVLLYEYPH